MYAYFSIQIGYRLDTLKALIFYYFTHEIAK